MGTTLLLPTLLLFLVSCGQDSSAVTQKFSGFVASYGEFYGSSGSASYSISYDSSSTTATITKTLANDANSIVTTVKASQKCAAQISSDLKEIGHMRLPIAYASDVGAAATDGTAMLLKFMGSKSSAEISIDTVDLRPIPPSVVDLYNISSARSFQ